MSFVSVLSALLYFSLGVVMTTFLFLNSATLMLSRGDTDVTTKAIKTVGEKQLRDFMHSRFSEHFGNEDISSDVILNTALSLWIQEFNKRSNMEETLRHRMGMQTKPCRCSKNQTFPLDEDTSARRMKEAMLWREENADRTEPLGVCKSMSPISYIGTGIVVEPLFPTRLIGLRIDPLFTTFYPIKKYSQKLTLTVATRKTIGKLVVGKVKLNLHSHEFRIFGNNTRTIRITGNTVETLNLILDNLIYKSVVYDISMRDIVDVDFMGFSVQVHVHVRRQTLPDLYDVGPEAKLSDKVTVITKTFERYEAVNRLVESVNKFYPDLKIVVADDSEVPQGIMGKNVKSTTMPFAEGLFAGRGVALSQVTTKYFLWVDDDFIFTDRTKLEYMLEKLEDPFTKLDLVGGTVNGKSYNKCFIFKAGGQNGDCLRSIHGRYHKLERFPQCDVVDVVVDFFMAKTSVVRQVGFDPEYRRIGHTAFFVDGLGKMRVAMCKDVDVDHDPIRNPKYLQYRARLVDTSDPKRHSNHLLFNNNLKCI